MDNPTLREIIVNWLLQHVDCVTRYILGLVFVEVRNAYRPCFNADYFHMICMLQGYDDLAKRFWHEGSKTALRYVAAIMTGKHAPNYVWYTTTHMCTAIVLAGRNQELQQNIANILPYKKYPVGLLDPILAADALSLYLRSGLVSHTHISKAMFFGAKQIVNHLYQNFSYNKHDLFHVICGIGMNLDCSMQMLELVCKETRPECLAEKNVTLEYPPEYQIYIHNSVPYFTRLLEVYGIQYVYSRIKTEKLLFMADNPAIGFMAFKALGALHSAKYLTCDPGCHNNFVMYLLQHNELNVSVVASNALAAGDLRILEYILAHQLLGENTESYVLALLGRAAKVMGHAFVNSTIMYVALWMMYEGASAAKIRRHLGDAAKSVILCYKKKTPVPLGTVVFHQDYYNAPINDALKRIHKRYGML